MSSSKFNDKHYLLHRIVDHTNHFLLALNQALDPLYHVSLPSISSICEKNFPVKDSQLTEREPYASENEGTVEFNY